MNRSLISTAAALPLSLCLWVTSANAIAPVEPDAPRTTVIRPSHSFIASELEVTPSLRLDAQRDALLAGRIASFQQRHGGQWDIRWDSRGDRAAVVQGSGIPLIPGRGNALDASPGFASSGSSDISMTEVAKLARSFIDGEPELLAAEDLDLRLDVDRSSVQGADKERWFLEFGQYHDGVPVDDAFVYVRIVHGNIVQFGTELIGDIEIDTTPATTREDAFAVSWQQLGFPAGTQVSEWLDAGELRIYPTLPAGESPGMRFDGFAGTGYGYVLAWRYVFRTEDHGPTWQLLVDAHGNQVIDVRDLTVNADATVTGGVYPTTNTDPEIVVEFPYTAVTNNGNKITDAFGVYDYTGGNATSTLNGQYFRMVDACGSISLSNNTTGNLAFGTSGGTDCTTPGVGGAGNTHASRTGFYHLTLINEKARTFLPTNNWLQSKVTANMNISQTCNASWNGSSVNFFRSGGGCSNTGEIAAVFLHEWGHGMDSNSGGAANENASGEALGDTFAFLETRDSCIGPNFRPGIPCRNCTTCTGVRDMADFSLGGARTIATPANITSNTGIDCDGLIGAGGISCPYTHPTNFSPYRGPMGYQGHCESYIASGANWDLTKMLVEEHGESGWADMDNIWYASLVPSKSSFRVESGGQCNPAAVVNGCGATNWYTVFLAADDDDGNLANGTPNACRIWDAYSAHGIACGARPECTQVETPDFSLEISPSSQSICAGEAAVYDAEVGALFGFSNPVTLDVSGHPPGSSIVYGSNPVAPGNATTVTIATGGAAAAGSYPLAIDGSAADSDGHSANATLIIEPAVQASPVLVFPADTTGDVDRRVDFGFQPVPDATSYAIEVATDPAFDTIVASATGLTTTTWTSPLLAPATQHFWRVSASGTCGPAAISGAFTFTTVDAMCSTPDQGIPDNTIAGLTDDMVIASGGAIGGLRVSVDVRHTRVGDLVFTLSNGSDSVILLDQPGVPTTSAGCLQDDVDAHFDSDAIAPAETMCNPQPPAISGDVKPQQSIDTAFAGESFSGTWRLNIADRAGQQTGTFVEWCLQAKPPGLRTVGGTVVGLVGSGLALSLNEGTSLAVTESGEFTFDTAILDGSAYAVTVVDQPGNPNQSCSVANGTGDVAGADIDNIVITCSTLTYTIGGTVAGLTGTGLRLLLNESTFLPLDENAAFQFPAPLADGSPYDVIVETQPSGPTQECTLENGVGNIDGGPVTNLSVSCIDVIDDTIFVDGFEE